MRSLVLLIPLCAFGQNTPHIRDWKPDSSEPAAQPKVACPSLHRLTGYDLSVMTVEVVPATNGTPEFCRVLIQAQPEIRIEVSLPAKWNRRLYMFGNGGYAGENLEAPGRVAHRNTALSAGFAVTQTNTGHDAAREPLATFTVNQQKFLDYAFRSLHVTAETAKRTVEAYYGSRPARSYYNGCSTGGRQGLILAQRYPEDFDGIIAGAPALNNVQTRLRSIATFQALAKAPIPIPKLKLLADRVYQSCDAADGVKDGLISDPRRCEFQAGRDLPVCAAADGPDCFTAAQIKTLESIYSDLMLNGTRVARGWPVGAEIAGPTGTSGWDGWLVRETGLSQSATYADSALKYMIFAKPDPNYDMLRFNLERDAHEFDWIAKVMNATDPDLSRFRERGGKMIMYFGWADPALNPLMGIGYYEDVVARMGPSTREFFKLYMLPGVFHCGGGVGPACFDPLAQLIPWVENRKVPERIVASQVESGKVLRTRPLCAYPQAAKYRGQGSVDDAANFSCSDRM
jgi:Tannase and feruloyl esterase